MKILECINLHKRYGREDVVSGLSFHLEEGEILALLGPNGAGKTTTIKMILGLTTPDKGEIRLKEGARIGYSPETPYFHPFLTGREVLSFYSRLQGINKAAAALSITELLELTGLLPAADRKVKTYSKGMLQRLAMAQALLGDPAILILDEPSSGLDALGRHEMIDMMRKLKKNGKTVIINSHILSDMEKIADRAIILVGGKIVREVQLHGGGKERKDQEDREYRETDRCVDLEQLFIQAAGGGNHAGADPKHIS